MKTFASLFSLLILFTACSSNNNEEQITTTQQILTSGVWTTTLNYEDLDLDGNFVEFGDDCEKDDPWTFNDDGTLDQGLGPVLCDPDEDDPAAVITSAWELQDNDQYLVLQFFADEIKFRIVSINDNQLILNIVEQNNPAGVYTQRVVLQR